MFDFARDDWREDMIVEPRTYRRLTPAGRMAVVWGIAAAAFLALAGLIFSRSQYGF